MSNFLWKTNGLNSVVMETGKLTHFFEWEFATPCLEGMAGFEAN